MARLASARVLVVGVGGVGSWCAEALVRTGLGAITLMDDDLVAESNVNRQCPATSLTVGEPKTEAMKRRLLAINPQCAVEARQERFERFDGLDGFDLVVDAIDSVGCKAELILGATASGVPIVSSMGAALRLDPTKVEVRRFDRVEGDGLARALRQRFKKLGRYPSAPFRCVDRAAVRMLRSFCERLAHASHRDVRHVPRRGVPADSRRMSRAGLKKQKPRFFRGFHGGPGGT